MPIRAGSILTGSVGFTRRISRFDNSEKLEQLIKQLADLSQGQGNHYVFV